MKLYAVRFLAILLAFLNGCLLSLVLQPQQLRDRLNKKYPPLLRGFAYEGAGMGLAMRSLWKPDQHLRFRADLEELDPGYLYQYYVGLGWWLHLHARFRTQSYVKWAAAVDSRYAPILFDGVGFKTGLFEYRVMPQILKRFHVFLPAERRSCYQGFGRSLWFLHRFEIAGVLAELESLPPGARADILSGVGIAVAYSMFDRSQHVETALQAIAAADRPAFLQGLAFGFEARRLQNSAYYALEKTKFSKEMQVQMEKLIDLVHHVHDHLLADIAPERFYPAWIDQVRTHLEGGIRG